MQNSNNKKLAINIVLMFLVYFLPKVFSFFLVPLYTSYLTTEEYGISDLIISTASLLAPFIALSTPGAILRFTIEDKEDNRPIWVAVRVYVIGMMILFGGLCAAYLIFHIKVTYLLFIFIIAGSSVLADINMSYTRGIEKVRLVTICGVGSSLVSIVCNILFIVVFQWGVYGFLIASTAGYVFNIVLMAICNRKKIFANNITTNTFAQIQREMLQFSIPTIFSGLSWWVISSSDRYFVSGFCGTSENGLYSVAYKIPTILQSVDNVFYQAWIYTLYDCYKTEDGQEYIVKVYDVYNFLFCFVGSMLIILTCPLAKILYAKEFYAAWRYVPFLVLSIVLNSAGGLAGNFLTIYKKTKISMTISLIAATTNMILNYLLIEVTGDALGAAIATAFTFFVTWVLYTYQGIKCSGIKVKWKKALLMYVVLVIQAIVIITSQNILLAIIGVLVIIILNGKNIAWAKSKGMSLLRRS
ncbi:oligosaccharide flippase family protein [[Ruminococcus] torques]|uniref:oligosaccharide flippase family protein n=1 Tax=[Ruminococcus] torques TaxID=33039 RepID=UPI00307904B6